MQDLTIQRRPPSASEQPDVRELYERIERLQRRIATMAAAGRAGDGELRRQRAAGRRP